MSKDTAAVDMLKFKVMWSVNLMRRAMTGKETNLACIKKASFVSVHLDYFQNNFLESLPIVNKKLIGRKL
jgi:hypothetical protein